MPNLVGSWQTNASASPVNSLSVTINGTTAGNILILAVSYSGSQSISVNNSFVIATSLLGTTSSIALYYLANIGGGNVTVTVNHGKSVTSAITLAIGEFDGSLTTPDGIESQAQLLVTAFTSGSGQTPSVAGDLAIGVHTHDLTTTTTATSGSGYTAVVATETYTAGLVQPLAVEYQTLSGTPSTNAQFTTALSANGSTILVIFRASAIFNESLSLGANVDITETPSNNLSPSVTLGTTEAHSAAASNVVSPATLTFQVNPDVSDTLKLIQAASTELDLTVDNTSEAVNRIASVLSLPATLSFSPSTQSSIHSSLSLGITSGHSSSAANTVSSAISLSTTQGFSTLCILKMSSTLSLVITSGFSDLSTSNGTQISMSVMPRLFAKAELINAIKSSTEDYLKLVTSKHNQQPKFMEMLRGEVQGQVDNINLLLRFRTLFDIDQAQGQQLDIIGLWVGISRNIQTPLTGVFFAFDTAGVGFDEGRWFGIGDSMNGLTSLSDGEYRILLKAKIAANHWDGTVPGAYSIWAIVFAGTDMKLLIQDGQDMTMAIILLSLTVTAVELSLLTNGYIALRPAGVLITGYYQETVADVPLFGFDVENSTIAGFDHGAWVKQIG